MKTKAMITMLVSLAMILTAPLVALGKGKPADPGSGGGNAGDAAGALYGDLYVIERDGNGVPLTRTVSYPELDEEGIPTGETIDVECNQPLAESCAKLPFWGECGNETTGVLDLPDDCVFDPEDDPCAVWDNVADQLQTVKFGRESVSRSPASVIDHSYAEALKAINLALPNSCTTIDGETDERAIKLDPAGRIMLCLATETVPVDNVWKTIDSPLENLGLYRAVMTDGCFGPIVEVVVGEGGDTIPVTTELYDNYYDNNSAGYGDPNNKEDAVGYLEAADLGHLVCPGGTVTKDDMLSAAVFIAAGADKTSPINLDEIINVNTYLKVNTWTYERVKKETILTVTYFEFADSGGPEGWFAYKRGVGGDACVPGTEARLLFENGGSFAIAEALDVFGDLTNGVDLRGDNGVAITVCREGFPLEDTFANNVVCDDPNNNLVYGPNPTDIGCGGANWFAQAAEDARKTIWYLHNWRVPELAY